MLIATLLMLSFLHIRYTNRVLIVCPKIMIIWFNVGNKEVFQPNRQPKRKSNGLQKLSLGNSSFDHIEVNCGDCSVVKSSKVGRISHILHKTNGKLMPIRISEIYFITLSDDSYFTYCTLLSIFCCCCDHIYTRGYSPTLFVASVPYKGSSIATTFVDNDTI